MVHGAPAVRAEGGSPGTEAEEAQPMDGGAARDRGSTALGFDEAGLSQDEKESSSSAVAPGCAEALEVLTPSTTMSFGNLVRVMVFAA
jgi:hypothetical protein